MDEFAFGSSTENSAFGPTHNPWDLERVPGGSSGGSAAAVSSGMAAMTLGSDTGGSIRQPGALCGVVAMKPTYGRVSRYGCVAFASSLDQIGPFTRTVGDTALALNAICGADEMDATSIERDPEDFTRALDRGVEGMRIAVVRDMLELDGCSAEVRASTLAAADALAGMGAEIVEVDLPNAEHALSAYYIIGPAEASSNLARFDGIRYGHRAADPEDVLDLYMRSRAEGFGPESIRRIMLGTYALSAGYYDAYYGQAQKVRTLIARDFAKVFETCDLVVGPTSPSVAFGIGERIDDQLAMYASDICTIPVNLAALPGMSIPSATVDGLPVGFQLIGPAFSENRMLSVAWALEQAFEFDVVSPRLAAAAAAGGAS
jgi:aspartyl-tRNA(Asn)/glutamyl-tRNA(Gln) amidotransferase subunit A